MEAVKATKGFRKTKSKTVEFERMRQAEKKKRRLEKALATSAAIRTELEKKKQKKKEQERLDEGAAIAESVALHVLVGEDSDESWTIMPNGYDLDSNIGVPHGWQSLSSPLDQPRHLHESFGWSFDHYSSGNVWDQWGSSSLMLSSYPFDADSSPPYYLDKENRGCAGISTDDLIAQAISSLQIADDTSYSFNLFTS